MKTLCYSVCVQFLKKISDKAYLVKTYDGSEDIIPVSHVFGPDLEIANEAYWISAWILERKNLQYSSKKKAWFDGYKKFEHIVTKIDKHIPERKDPVKPSIKDDLIR